VDIRDVNLVETQNINGDHNVGVMADESGGDLCLESEEEILDPCKRRKNYKRMYQHNYKHHQAELRATKSDQIAAENAKFVARVESACWMSIGDNPK
jgi:hypothetical protein